MRPRTILFVADSDSQLNPAYLLASSIASELGWNLVGNLVPSRRRVSRRQLMNVNVDCPLTFHSLDHIASNVALDLDAIVVFLPGSQLHRFRIAVEQESLLHNPTQRPILITGYNGVVYEKHLEGLLWRTGYDVIAVNSESDFDRFARIMGQFGLGSAPLVRAGLPLAQNPAAPGPLPRPNGHPIRGLLFACQAATPTSRVERMYLLERLRDYAYAHPERTVYVKPRTLPDELTFHPEPFHYELLHREKYGDAKPPNLFFAYGSLASYLPKVELIVTVSSTALVEAMAAGVRGAVLTDVGIKETLGNHFFVGSGLLTTMEELIADRLPEADAGWLAKNGFGDHDDLSNVARRVERLHDEQDADGAYLPFHASAYTRQLTPYVFSRMLPENGTPARKPAPARPTTLARKARKLYRKPGRFFADAWQNRMSATRKQQPRDPPWRTWLSGITR